MKDKKTFRRERLAYFRGGILSLEQKFRHFLQTLVLHGGLGAIDHHGEGSLALGLAKIPVHFRRFFSGRRTRGRRALP